MFKKGKVALLALSAVMLLSFSGCKKDTTAKEIKVTEWNNFYEGKNIHFYYEDFKNINIEELSRLYQLNEKIGSAGDELERAVKITTWLNKVMEYDKGSISTKEESLSILKERETGKKASDREFALVFDQSCTALGIHSRRGEFRVKEASSSKGNDDYYKAAEIWSDKFNKWILIDTVSGAYFVRENTPQSALELIEKGLDGVDIVGVTDKEKYKSNMKKFFYSYSILIDNSIYGKKRSNAYITYIGKGQLPELKLKQGFIPPTIFVNEANLFNIGPKTVYNDDKSDKVPTLIIMKKSLEDNKGDDKTFVIGTFMNSIMVPSYYLKFDEEPWKKIDMYTDVTLKKGKNSIKLSLDGSTSMREITIEDNR